MLSISNLLMEELHWSDSVPNFAFKWLPSQDFSSQDPDFLKGPTDFRYGNSARSVLQGTKDWMNQFQGKLKETFGTTDVNYAREHLGWKDRWFNPTLSQQFKTYDNVADLRARLERDPKFYDELNTNPMKRLEAMRSLQGEGPIGTQGSRTINPTLAAAGAGAAALAGGAATYGLMKWKQNQENQNQNQNVYNTVQQ